MKRALLLLVLWPAACRTGPELAIVPPPRPFADTARVPRPAVREFSESHDLIETLLFDPAERAVNVARRVRRARGRSEARNLNAWDDVENSSWFEHRNDARRLTPEEIRHGPDGGGVPSPSGPLTVVAPKRSGVTPGFRVLDERGDEWQFKLDPPDMPELASAAEAIATRLVWAAGYHTADVSIVVFDRARLVIAPNATMRGSGGRERTMTQADLDAILARGARLPEGRIRASATRWIRGRLGSFAWEGRRRDDANDTLPHQHRRELRGFYVISSWINHVDSRRGNTFDQFVGDTSGYVRHIMQDVSSTLGSGSDRAHTPMDGSESLFDFAEIAARSMSLGFYRARWETVDAARPSPSVGHFSTSRFDPLDWRPARPNAAFEERTDRDGYWGAKLVASFTDDQLRAAVSAGEYSDPSASEAILTALIGRRDAIRRAWFSRVSPVERVAATCSGDALTITFVDLAIEQGVADFNRTRYSAELATGRGRRILGGSGFPAGSVVLPTALSRLVQAAAGTDPSFRLSLQAHVDGHARKPATIYLLPDDARSCYRVAGLAH